MFRRLMALETEALRSAQAETASMTDPSEAALLEQAGKLARCMPPLPHRFGVCASGYDS